MRVGRGHRLHPDRVVAADRHAADLDDARLVATERFLIENGRFCRGNISGGHWQSLSDRRTIGHCL